MTAQKLHRDPAAPVLELHRDGDAAYVVSANHALYPAFPMPKQGVIGGKVYLRNRIDRLN